MTKHLDEVVRNSVAIPSKKEKDTDKFPKAYFINNLLKLSNVLSFSEIEKVALI